MRGFLLGLFPARFVPALLRHADGFQCTCVLPLIPPCPPPASFCSLSPSESAARPLSWRGKLTSYRLCCAGAAWTMWQRQPWQRQQLWCEMRSHFQWLWGKKNGFLSLHSTQLPRAQTQGAGAPGIHTGEGGRDSCLPSARLGEPNPFLTLGWYQTTGPGPGEGNELLPVTALASHSCLHQKRKAQFFFFCRKSKGFYQTESLTHGKVSPWRRVPKASYCLFYEQPK